MYSISNNLKIIYKPSVILKLLYFYHKTASLFVMTFLCLTIVYQELCLFSERLSMSAKNSLLLCLKKNQLRILSKALSNAAEFIHCWRKLSTQELLLLNCDVWRSLLRVSWTARRSYQSILKEMSPVYSFEGLMLKLKLQYFGYLVGRTDLRERLWCWERLRAGGEGDNRGWDGWMASPTWWTWVWASSGSWWWTGKPGVLESLG